MGRPRKRARGEDGRFLPNTRGSVVNGETDTGVLSSDKALPKPASLSPFRNNRKRPRQPRPVPELAEWFQTVASLGQSLLFDSDKKIGPRDLDQLADVVFQAYEEGAVLPQPTEKEVKLNQEQRRLIRRVAHAKKKANLIAALRIRQRLKQDGKLNSGRPAKGAPGGPRPFSRAGIAKALKVSEKSVARLIRWMEKADPALLLKPSEKLALALADLGDNVDEILTRFDHEALHLAADPIVQELLAEECEEANADLSTTEDEDSESEDSAGEEQEEEEEADMVDEDSEGSASDTEEGTESDTDSETDTEDTSSSSNRSTGQALPRNQGGHNRCVCVKAEQLTALTVLTRQQAGFPTSLEDIQKLLFIFDRRLRPEEAAASLPSPSSARRFCKRYRLSYKKTQYRKRRLYQPGFFKEMAAFKATVDQFPKRNQLCMDEFHVRAGAGPLRSWVQLGTAAHILGETRTSDAFTVVYVTARDLVRALLFRPVVIPHHGPRTESSGPCPLRAQGFPECPCEAGQHVNGMHACHYRHIVSCIWGPHFERGDGLIMDNLNAHHDRDVLEALYEFGVWPLFMPVGAAIFLSVQDTGHITVIRKVLRERLNHEWITKEQEEVDWAGLIEHICLEKLPEAAPFWDHLGYEDGDGLLTRNGPPDVPTGDLSLGKGVYFVPQRGRPAALPRSLRLSDQEGPYTLYRVADRGIIAFARALVRAADPTLVVPRDTDTGKPLQQQFLRKENAAMRDWLQQAGLTEKQCKAAQGNKATTEKLQLLAKQHTALVKIYHAAENPASLISSFKPGRKRPEQRVVVREGFAYRTRRVARKHEEQAQSSLANTTPQKQVVERSAEQSPLDRGKAPSTDTEGPLLLIVDRLDLARAYFWIARRSSSTQGAAPQKPQSTSAAPAPAPEPKIALPPTQPAVAGLPNYVPQLVCFANVVFQMLFCMDPYRALGRPDGIDVDALPEGCAPVLNVLRLLRSAAEEEEPVDRVVDKQIYSDVVDTLRLYFEQLFNGQQQDASELLAAVLDTLSIPELHLPEQHMQYTEAVKQHCNRCQYQQAVEETGRICSLPLPVELVARYGKSAVPLSDLFEHYQFPELVECNNRACREDGATKALTRRFRRHGRYWCLQLKRFRYDAKGSKVHARVDAPLVFSNGADAFYLRAAVLHAGATLSSGHYTILVIEGEHAAVIDDARVTAADARAVLADPRFQKQTYLLLYERVEEGMERPKKKLRSSRAASHVLVEPEVPVMRFEAREE